MSVSIGEYFLFLLSIFLSVLLYSQDPEELISLHHCYIFLELGWPKLQCPIQEMVDSSVGSGQPSYVQPCKPISEKEIEFIKRMEIYETSFISCEKKPKQTKSFYKYS